MNFGAHGRGSEFPNMCFSTTRSRFVYLIPLALTHGKSASRRFKAFGDCVTVSVSARDYSYHGPTAIGGVTGPRSFSRRFSAPVARKALVTSGALAWEEASVADVVSARRKSLPLLPSA